MKKLLYTLLVVSLIFSACEEEDTAPTNSGNNNNNNNNTVSKTYVPGDGFEQYLIDNGYDDVLDDSVLTTNINTISSLGIPPNTVSDLTGIEDFSALYDLFCPENPITYLDLSNNTNLESLNVYECNLYYLDLSNGNTGADGWISGPGMSVIAGFNYNLTCVGVDNVDWANFWLLNNGGGPGTSNNYYFYPEPVFSTLCN